MLDGHNSDVARQQEALKKIEVDVFEELCRQISVTDIRFNFNYILAPLQCGVIDRH